MDRYRGVDRYRGRAPYGVLHYRKRGSASYIIGSAEALPMLCYRKRGSASYIVREVRSVRERERERERQREREREIDGSDVIIVALKLAMGLHIPMPKIRTIAVSSHFPLPKNRSFLFYLHTSHRTIVALKFTLSVAKKNRPLCSDSLLNGASGATSDRKPKTNDQILPSPIIGSAEALPILCVRCAR